MAMVMAVQRQHSRRVSGLLENRFFNGWKPGNGFELDEDYDF
jgi:hypothetical protein